MSASRYYVLTRNQKNKKIEHAFQRIVRYGFDSAQDYDKSADIGIREIASKIDYEKICDTAISGKNEIIGFEIKGGATYATHYHQKGTTQLPKRDPNLENYLSMELPYIKEVLIKAIKTGNISSIKTILTCREDIDVNDPKLGLLGIAIADFKQEEFINAIELQSPKSSQHQEVSLKAKTVRLLIEQGADSNQKMTRHGIGVEITCTPLALALQNSDYEIAQLLIDCGANPNGSYVEKDVESGQKTKASCLWLVLSNKSFSPEEKQTLLKTMLKNQACDATSTVERAIEEVNLNYLQQLVAAGAKIDEKTYDNLLQNAQKSHRDSQSTFGKFKMALFSLKTVKATPEQRLGIVSYLTNQKDKLLGQELKEMVYPADRITTNANVVSIDTNSIVNELVDDLNQYEAQFSDKTDMDEIEKLHLKKAESITKKIEALAEDTTKNAPYRDLVKILNAAINHPVFKNTSAALTLFENKKLIYEHKSNRPEKYGNSPQELTSRQEEPVRRQPKI